MFINPAPRPAEWLHNRACLSAAVIAAVQNLHDEEGGSDFTFRLAMQDNPLTVADGYLADGLMTCVCPEPEEAERCAEHGAVDCSNAFCVADA